jgi:Peptidase family M23
MAFPREMLSRQLATSSSAPDDRPTEYWGIVMHRQRLFLSLAAVFISSFVSAAPAPQKTSAAVAAAPLSVTLRQGEVARWPGIAAKTCLLGGKKYAPVDSVCYFPFDIEAKPGRYPVGVIDQDGKRHLATATVEKVDWPKVDITLLDDAYINVTPENQRRSIKEREAVLKLFAFKDEPPQFSLPLSAPASPLPKNEDDFGSDRTFNGKLRSQHTGRDYPVNAGTPIKAIASGKVVLIGDHFLTGNSVYIDHGDGMVSANFHMSEITVKEGDVIKRGAVIGKAGGTGRVSGVHLHLGIRWLAARVDPQPLLDNPSQLHAVGEKPATSERKEEKAKAEPKESNASIRRDDEG